MAKGMAMSEYIHAALLLHAVKKEITEKNLENVIRAAGVAPDIQRIKLLVSALSGVDIDKVLSSVSATPSVVPAAGVAEAQAAPPKTEAKPEEEKKEEITGLGALFE